MRTTKFEPGSTSAGFQWTGSTSADFQQAFRVGLGVEALEPQVGRHGRLFKLTFVS